MRKLYIFIIFFVLSLIFAYFYIDGYQAKTLIYKVLAPPQPNDNEQTNLIDQCPISDGFDFPVGKPNAKGYYNAQGFGGKNHHLGEDWNGKGGGDSDLGDPVYAVSNGIVVYADNAQLGWGNIVRILHKYRYNNSIKYIESFYAHLKDIKVEVGDIVKRGDRIGSIGNAGGIYLAHLHFEIRETIFMPIGGGYSKNTEGYLKPTAFILKNRPGK